MPAGFRPFRWLAFFVRPRPRPPPLMLGILRNCPSCLVAAPLLHTSQALGRGLRLIRCFFLQICTFLKWAMLESNQRPPPCKLGQCFPGRYCPVGKSGIYKRFLAFLTPLFSCSVRVCPAPVAARLQHLNLCRPAPFPPTLSGPGSTLC